MLIETFKGQLIAYKGSYMLGIPSAVLAALTSYTGASGESFLLWIIISTLDLVFGIIYAIINHKFSAVKLYQWVFKIFIQLTTVVLFALVLRAFKLASDVELFFGSWILFFYMLMDATSIFDKMLLLGVLPKPAYILFKFFHKRTVKVLSSAFDDPHLAADLEKALSEKSRDCTRDCAR